VQGPGASPFTTTAKALAVPTGNPGNILFHVVVAPIGAIKYVKNGGAAVTVTTDVTVSFANTDTLAFTLQGAGDNATITATDAFVGKLIGTAIVSTA
jgi:hypothetical protein